MNDLDSLLTTRQLQDLLQVDRITIYRMLNDGRLQGFKVGGQWRFSRRDIEQWLQEQRADLDVVEQPRPDDSLQPSSEALPLACIQAIQSIFAEVLGVGAVTTSVAGTPLTPISNSCGFCNLLLDTQVGRQRCITSWRAAAGQSGGSPRLATCHAGLHYVWGRVEVQGQLVAAIHAGQLLVRPPAGDNGWRERLTRLAAETGVPEQQLRDAFTGVRVLEEDRLQQVPRLLQRVADAFAEIGEERLNLLSRLQRIAEITAYA